MRSSELPGALASRCSVRVRRPRFCAYADLHDREVWQRVQRYGRYLPAYVFPLFGRLIKNKLRSGNEKAEAALE